MSSKNQANTSIYELRVWFLFWFWKYFRIEFHTAEIGIKNGLEYKNWIHLWFVHFMTILCKSFQHFQGYLITSQGISRLVLWIFMQCNETKIYLWLPSCCDHPKSWWRGMWMFQERNKNSSLIILLPANIVQYIVG